MKTQSFEKHTGEKTELKILKEKLISSGTAFRNIYDAIIEINGHKDRYAIKKYKSDNAQEEAKQAFQNYGLAKKAGLKVFPTFRLGEDGRSILMTMGRTEDQICIGSNSNEKVTDFDRPLLEKIENLDQFLEEYFTECKKMIEKGISAHHDVPFFFVSKTEPTKLDFVLGDLDNIERLGSGKIPKDRALNIIHRMRRSLNRFLLKNVHPDFIGDIWKQAEAHYHKNLDEVLNGDLEYKGNNE